MTGSENISKPVIMPSSPARYFGKGRVKSPFSLFLTGNNYKYYYERKI